MHAGNLTHAGQLHGLELPLTRQMHNDRLVRDLPVEQTLWWSPP